MMTYRLICSARLSAPRKHGGKGARFVVPLLAAASLMSGGCALQPAYVTPTTPAPAPWSVAPAPASDHGAVTGEAWWPALGDKAVDRFVEAAFADNPTLLQAMTRVDEARATLNEDSASRMPGVDVDASITRAKSRNTSLLQPGLTTRSTSASLGPSFSWELDLFGRISQSVEAAQNHLDARTADSASTRLTLAADIANDVLSLRACENSRRVWVDDIASREKTLALTRLKLNAGFAAPVDEARILSGLATSRTSLATQAAQCARQVNALVALTGEPAGEILSLVGAEKSTTERQAIFMPQAPAAVPQLPATVLTSHPDVVSAERETAAAWADIAVARADRLPRVDLAAALTGQWIRMAGSSVNFDTWSVGPSLSGTLFDGGAGKAKVQAAQARYVRAAANLNSTLRTTVQDVENALADQASAASRVTSTREGTAAARTTFQASDAQWQAGAVSLFELEDSRRQFASAQDAEISARRDQGQAWIALVKATGAAVALTPDTPSHE